MKRQRVVITGLGVVSSIGLGKDAFWKALLAGQSGISRIERFDTSGYDAHVGGEVKDFRPGQFLEANETKRLGRAAQFAITATLLALRDASIDLPAIADTATSACFGTTMSDSPAIEALDDMFVSQGEHFGKAMRLQVLQYPSCMIAAQVAARFQLRGKAVMIPTACAAGNYAIAYANDLIRSGQCEVVLAGGVDPLSRYAFAGFNRMFAVSSDHCRPFDRNRKGIIVGEGAGVLVLESFEHAERRGAEAYAEIRGYGVSCDAHHMTIPSVEGMTQVMQSALVDAEISPEDVSYISAHGTGTVTNDQTECAAMANVFGERLSDIPVSSIKSMLGHTMGAASALEAIACTLAVYHGWLPPTINFETPDPLCPIDCIPNTSRRHPVSVALNNSFAFGGNNACLVIANFN